MKVQGRQQTTAAEVEDSGRRETAIKPYKFHIIIANMPHKRFELSRKIAKKSHTTVREFSCKIAPCQVNW